MRIMTRERDSFMCISFQLLNKTICWVILTAVIIHLNWLAVENSKLGSDVYAGRVFLKKTEDDLMSVQWLAMDLEFTCGLRKGN